MCPAKRPETGPGCSDMGLFIFRTRIQFQEILRTRTAEALWNRGSDFGHIFILNLLTKSHGHICPVLEPSCRQSNSKSSMQRIRVHFASKKRQILELPPSVKTSLSNLKQLLGTFCGQNSIETVFFLLAQLKQWLCNQNWTKMWFWSSYPYQ